ncbi:MAG: replication-associated recombination protein A [Firmicutes bacterium]|nr:replication-associated recombination protein A [Candidatus Fermentithermobacillaceae bacterium]
MAPRDFSEFFGQEELVGEGRALRRAIEEDRIGSMIFWGPPGTGKTALGRLIASMTRSRFVELSAVTAGVADIRKATEEAALWKSRGKRTILFIDEIHRFNKAQQDVLLPHVEKGTFILIGATTENPFFAVNPALISRSRIFRFQPLKDRDIEAILRRAIADEERGYGRLALEIEDGVIEHIIRFAKGDARIALNTLEALVNAGEKDPTGKIKITLKIAEDVTQTAPLLYDRAGDQHYDIISAYIKSIRGSDPDAAVYWLARMLKGGEDPRFIARRLVIAAAEDIGNADPMALVLAEAALRTVEHVGMPEARIPLAQATLYLACAPKSNASYLAIDKAMKDVEEKPAYPVPPHLRGTGYYGAEKLGHGVGYLYPHEFPGHYVPQQYLPQELEGTRYYEPDPQGFEKTLRERLDELRSRVKRTSTP